MEIPVIESIEKIGYNGPSTLEMLTLEDLEFVYPNITGQLAKKNPDEVSPHLPLAQLIHSQEAHMSKEIVHMAEKILHMTREIDTTEKDLKKYGRTLNRPKEFFIHKSREISEAKSVLQSLRSELRSLREYKSAIILATMMEKRLLPSKDDDDDDTVIEIPSKQQFLNYQKLPTGKRVHSYFQYCEEMKRLSRGKPATSTTTILPPPVRAISKTDWIEQARMFCLDASTAGRNLISEKRPLDIHISGSFGKGFGAIVRGSRFMPVIVRSRVLSHENSVSTFHTRLNGVALGLKIALEYGISQFYLKVPSLSLRYFMRGIWDPNSLESGHVSEDDLRSLLRQEDRCDIERIYSLTLSIISDLDLLRDKGMNFFKVEPVMSTKNKAAEVLANLNLNQNMFFEEIFGNEELAEILYQDAVY